MYIKFQLLKIPLFEMTESNFKFVPITLCDGDENEFFLIEITSLIIPCVDIDFLWCFPFVIAKNYLEIFLSHNKP